MALLTDNGVMPQDSEELATQLVRVEGRDIDLDDEASLEYVRDRMTRSEDGYRIELSDQETRHAQNIVDEWDPRVFKATVVEDNDWVMDVNTMVNPPNSSENLFAINLPDECEPGDLVMSNLVSEKEYWGHPLLNDDDNERHRIPSGRYLSTVETADELYERVTTQKDGRREIEIPAAGETLVLEDEEGVTDEALLLAAESSATMPHIYELFFDPEERDISRERVEDARNNLYDRDITPDNLDYDLKRVMMNISSENMTGAAVARHDGAPFERMDLLNLRGDVRTEASGRCEEGVYIVGLEGYDHAGEVMGRLE
jgi:hypothetical protein